MDILTFPNAILRKKAKNIDVNDSEEKKQIKKLVLEMQKLMYEHNGIGLAGPQVGVSKRIFIIDVEQEVEKDSEGEVISRVEGRLMVFINPVIVEKEGQICYEEGCLSVPGVYDEVKRAEKIRVEYFDVNFEKKELVAEGLLSVVIQHENDHLDGKLFIDKLADVKRTMIKNKILKGKKI